MISLKKLLKITLTFSSKKTSSQLSWLNKNIKLVIVLLSIFLAVESTCLRVEVRMYGKVIILNINKTKI